MSKKYFLLLIILVLLTGCQRSNTTVSVNILTTSTSETMVTTTASSSLTTGSTSTLPTIPQLSEETESVLPVKVNVPERVDLPIPFVSQAPLRNWEMPYQEACEEASMLTIANYYQVISLNNSNEVNGELLLLINWEEENGYAIDINAAEVAEILKNKFNLNSRLEKEVTVDRIKYELAQGHPIIVPTAGRLLENPYFKNPGPIYHMLVIRGYDNKNFITNDVGTNTKGEAFKYRYENLLSSIHDWQSDLAVDGMTEEEMALGQKVMIVIE